MNHIVFPSLALANLFAANIDAEIGYPKPGVNVGGGIHVAPLFVTQRHGAIFKHPTLNEWAYPDDAAVVSRRGRVPLPPQAQSRVLGADWFPGAPPVVLPFVAEDNRDEHSFR
jgi:hypothetical protein